MYNNSLIQMVTTSETSVLSNGIIPLTTIQRRRGKAIQSGNNGILLQCPGYYKISGTITCSVPTAGTVSIQIQKGGINVSGIMASSTIATASTDLATLSFSGIIRIYCNEGISTITLLNSGVAITLENAALDIEYLD